MVAFQPVCPTHRGNAWEAQIAARSHISWAAVVHTATENCRHINVYSKHRPEERSSLKR